MKQTVLIIWLLLFTSSPALCQEIRAQLSCDATYKAWSIDPNMKNYLNTHTCVCDERLNTHICKPKSSGAAAKSSQAVPQPTSKRKTSSSDIMRGALKGALDDYAADSARISRAVAAQAEANKALVKDQNELQAGLIKDEEAKKRLTISNEQGLRIRSSQEVATQLTGLPTDAGFTIADSLEKNSKNRQNASELQKECSHAKEVIDRFKAGMPKLEADMAKNRRLIQDAEQGIKGAVKDAGQETAGFFYNKKYDELEDRFKDFLKAKKQLSAMKKKVEALEKLAGAEKKSTKLTKAQIDAAKMWIENGIKYSNDLTDSVKMSYKYNTDGGPKNREQADGYMKRALSSLDDFNTRFMNDAGGWEFAGEHLSEATGGPAGKLLFKQAVLGIKLTANAGSVVIDRMSISVYKENQERLELEHSKRLQRIMDLNLFINNNHCM